MIPNARKIGTKPVPRNAPAPHLAWLARSPSGHLGGCSPRSDAAKPRVLLRSGREIGPSADELPTASAEPDPKRLAFDPGAYQAAHEPIVGDSGGYTEVVLLG